MAERRNLTIDKGTTFNPSFFISEADRVTPINLTGVTARMHVRPTISSTTLLLDMTTENGRILIFGPEGYIELKLTPLETSALTWEKGVYDLEIEFVDGTVHRLVQGNISASLEVTR